MSAPRTIVLAKSTSRYAQLTYTSFDDGNGRGGWGVKDEIGELSDAERDELTAAIVTRFDLLPVLPDFPTPEQTAGRPSRLSYALLDESRAAYWHTVDAGRDASGRPGNVFAHVLLDRTAGSYSHARPIQLWESPGWLRPYGVGEVTASRLTTDHPPMANPAMAASAIIAFLLDRRADRQTRFRVLLDAVAAALAGGPAVVLVCDTHAEAAAWIGAVSHFMAPQAARRFCWSTHDAPEAALAQAERGVHLIVVPRDRGEVPSNSAVVVIDAAQQPVLGDLPSGTAHRLTRAQVPVTAWSALAEGVLADDDIAAAVLARQDVIAAELGDGPLSPAWPLAVAVDEHPELGEFAAEARRVIADDAPDRAVAIEWMAQLIERAESQRPASAQAALTALRAERGSGAGGRRSARFVAAVLADPQWLRQAGLADVPRPPIPTVRLGPDADTIVALGDQLRTRAVTEAADVALSALQLAELFERLAVRDDAFERAAEVLAAVLDASGVGFLWTPGWADDRAAAEISAAVRARYVRPLAAATAPAQLWALPPAAARWLYDDAGAVAVSVPEAPTADDMVVFPYAVRALLAAAPEYAGSMPQLAAESLVSAAIDMAARAPAIADADCAALIDALVGLARPDAALLLQLSRDGGERVPVRALQAAVFTQPLDPTSLRRIVDELADLTVPMAAAAQLRLWYGAPEQAPPADVAVAVDAVATSAGAEHQVAAVAPDLAVMLAVGPVLARSAGYRTGDDPRWQRALAGRCRDLLPDVAAMLSHLAGRPALPMEWLVGQAFTRHCGLPVPVAVLDAPEFGGRRWDEELIGAAIREGRYRGPLNIAQLREVAWPFVRGLGAADAERFFATYRDAGRHWLMTMGLDAENADAARRNRLWNREDH